MIVDFRSIGISVFLILVFYSSEFPYSIVHSFAAPYPPDQAAVREISFGPAAGVYCLQDYARFLPVSAKHLTPDNAWQKRNEFLSWEDFSATHDLKETWICYSVRNNTGRPQRFYLNGQLMDFVDLYQIIDDRPVPVSSSGYLVPFGKRSIQDWGSMVSSSVTEGTTQTYLFRLKSVTRNSRFLIDYAVPECMKIYTQSGYEDTYKLSRHLTYFFLGVIFIMFIYNLCISVMTLYREYFLFSIYNMATVLSCFFITETHLEAGLFETADWIRNFQYICLSIVPLSYCWFSIKYLDIKTHLPVIYKAMRWISMAYPVIFINVILSYYSGAFFLIVVMTTLFFLVVLYSSVRLAVTIPSARFLLAGNLILGVIGIAQVINIPNWISTRTMINWSYILQMTEIVIFSFAVAYKLRVSKKAMYAMEHQNEIQKERLKMEETMRRQLENENNQKARSLTATSIQLLNFNDKITQIINTIRMNPGSDNSPAQQIIKELDSLRQSESHWHNIKVHFENVHPGFFTKLDHHFPNLSSNDHKLLTFLKMKLSNKEIALILNVTIRAIEQSKRRVKKKLGMNPDELDIIAYLERHAI